MPDPATLVQWLIKAGPYAVALILALWLKLERAERIAAQKDAQQLRDKRAEELKQGAVALAELGETTRNRMREHDEKIGALLALKREGS